MKLLGRSLDRCFAEYKVVENDSGELFLHIKTGITTHTSTPIKCRVQLMQIRNSRSTWKWVSDPIPKIPITAAWIIETRGGTKEVASTTGVDTRTVMSWASNGFIPIKYAEQLDFSVKLVDNLKLKF